MWLLFHARIKVNMVNAMLDILPTGSCFVVVCYSLVHFTHIPEGYFTDSGRSCDCPNASKATLKEMLKDNETNQRRAVCVLFKFDNDWFYPYSSGFLLWHWGSASETTLNNLGKCIRWILNCIIWHAYDRNRQDYVYVKGEYQST